MNLDEAEIVDGADGGGDAAESGVECGGGFAFGGLGGDEVDAVQVGGGRGEAGAEGVGGVVVGREEED